MTRDYPVDDIRHSGEVALPAQAQDLACRLLAGAEVPAVWLDAGGLLVDGHHRRLAHELAGRSKILAVVLTEREDDRFEELLAHGAHPLDAYAEIIGTPAPRNFWARPGKETPR